MLNFTANPIALINEFTTYLRKKQLHNDYEEAPVSQGKNHTILLGKFASFLAENDRVPHRDILGILNVFLTALNASSENDYCIIDSGATNHMINQITNPHDFKKLSNPSQVLVVNGKCASIVRKGKINLLSNHIELVAFYVPSFPFQLLSVRTITNSINCLAIFSPYNVVFQDITKRAIGEGFFFSGLYYIAKDSKDPKVFQVSSIVS